MDFKSELEQGAETTRAKCEEELRQITLLQDNLLELDEQMRLLEIETDEITSKNAPLIKQLNENEKLIAMWEISLLEHKDRLRTNEAYLKTITRIQKNEKTIQRSLPELEAKKEELEAEILQFYANNTVDSSIKNRLLKELSDLQTEHGLVSAKITELRIIEQKLHWIVQLFFNFLKSINLISDPIVLEQEKLKTIDDTITQIEKNLQEYEIKREVLDTLKSEEEIITLQREGLLADQETLQHKEEIQKSIRETQKTIDALDSKIAQKTREYKKIEKQIAINNKSLKADEKRTKKEQLKAEIADKSTLVRTKMLALAQKDNPVRNQSKTALLNTLLATCTAHEQSTQTKHELAKTSHFFKPTQQEIGVNSVPNHLALVKIQHAIQKFQTGIDSKSEEHKILSQIISKLLVWQMAESDQNLNQPFSKRQTDHKEMCSDIAALMEKLPFDNPLKSARNYIASLTTPVEIEEASSRLGKGGRRV